MSEKKIKNQYEEVQRKLDSQVTEITDIVKLPGIEKLHLRSKEEIAAVLANVIKSRAGITKFVWDIKNGHLEITCNGNPWNQIRD